MKITYEHRKTLSNYLKKFYTFYPNEKFTIFNFVRFLKKRLRNNKDAWFGVSGDTGVGKSYFVINCLIISNRPCNLTKNITYMPRGTEIIDKLKKLNFNFFLVDEAARQMRRVQWHDKQQQMVNTAAMTERYKNNAVFLNMPSFDEFTKSMKMSSMQFRIILPYRTKSYARVIIQRKSRNWRSMDPWYDKKADEIYQKFEKKFKTISNEHILKIERSMPSYVMDFIIPNLELVLPDITKEYDRLRRESRNEGLMLDQEKQDKKDIWRERYKEKMTVIAKLLVNNELDIGKVRVSKQDIAKALNISTNTLNKYLKS